MTHNIFGALGIPSGQTASTTGQLIAFQPDPNSAPPFSFMQQIAEGQAQIDVLWNAVGLRYWVRVKNSNGEILTFYPLVATPSMSSPLKIDLLLGVSTSKLYFYEDIQSFHLLNP